MILLSDANILIDLGYVDGLEILTKIAPTEVLDIVLQECEDDRQPGLTAAIIAAGIQVIETEASWLPEAAQYRSAELSLQDQLNIHYAKSMKRVLLATDKPLRARCKQENVEVHGSLWLVQEASRLSLLPAADLCQWLAIWPTVGSRLPEAELRQLRKDLGC